jgi:hypothetical protein
MIEVNRTYKIRFLIRLDFKFISVATFIGFNDFPKFVFFMHMQMRVHDNMPVLYVLTKRKNLPNIFGASLWQFTLIPMVILVI